MSRRMDPRGGRPLNFLGQDLIEYALVAALIAFAATTAMKSVATRINTAFTNIGNKLTTYTGSSSGSGKKGRD